MKDKEWGSVRQPQSLLDEITSYLKTRSAAKHGYVNTAQFVTHSVRMNLERLTSAEGRVVIYDKKTDEYLNFSIKEDGKTIFCETCDTDDCTHTKIANKDFELKLMLLKNVKKILKKKRDFKSQEQHNEMSMPSGERKRTGG